MYLNAIYLASSVLVVYVLRADGNFCNLVKGCNKDLEDRVALLEKKSDDSPGRTTKTISAFYTCGTGSAVSGLRAGETISLPSVLFNTGEFDPKSSHFIVPTDGTYSCFISSLTSGERTHLIQRTWNNAEKTLAKVEPVQVLKLSNVSLRKNDVLRLIVYPENIGRVEGNDEFCFGCAFQN